MMLYNRPQLLPYKEENSTQLLFYFKLLIYLITTSFGLKPSSGEIVSSMRLRNTFTITIVCIIYLVIVSIFIFCKGIYKRVMYKIIQ
jgi:hypothetical protein